MELKIITINIWRYFDWDKRKKGLINFLKKVDADVIFLQEAAYDDRLKERYENQIDEINRELGYGHFAFGKEADMIKWHKEPIDWKMYYGLGIISKYPINHEKIMILPRVERNKDFGFLHVRITVGEKDIDLINVHLENTDKGSEKHLKFLMNWCNEKNIQPIIAGDFNMKKVDTLIFLANKNFEISYQLKNYFSFMPTQFSNNKEPITLDYIISHKNKFSMGSVDCLKTDVSDHYPVLATINIK